MLRGHLEETISLFSYVSIEEMIPARHPLRQIRSLATEALQRLDRTFEKLYACADRPSIRPEQLLLALLLQAIYGLRSERLLAAWPGFFGKRFSNSTHPSSQDSDARLARRSPSHPALLSFLGHVLMDHRYHSVVDSRLTLADGYGERTAAQQMVADLKGKYPKTISADKGYDTKGFAGLMRWCGVTPHVAQNTKRRGGLAIDQRTTRHLGYCQSLNARGRIEKVFGWIKQAAGLRQCKHRG